MTTSALGLRNINPKRFSRETFGGLSLAFGEQEIGCACVLIHGLTTEGTLRSITMSLKLPLCDKKIRNLATLELPG